MYILQRDGSNRAGDGNQHPPTYNQRQLKMYTIMFDGPPDVARPGTARTRDGVA